MDSKKPRLLPKIWHGILYGVKQSDYFGTPVSLNFKGETKFKTVVGGVVSLSILIGLLIYTGFLMNVMIKREDSSLNVVTQIDRLIYNPVI